MRRKWIACLAALLLCVGTGLSEGAAGLQPENEAKEGSYHMQLKIDETPVTVAWESNASVEALRERAADGLTIAMSMYGGFEQVGSLGDTLPRQDEQTVTNAGDIVLYAGDQIVVFYGSNSWAYTRLGRITDKTPDEMRELLSRGDVTLSITAGQ